MVALAQDEKEALTAQTLADTLARAANEAHMSGQYSDPSECVMAAAMSAEALFAQAPAPGATLNSAEPSVGTAHAAQTVQQSTWQGPAVPGPLAPGQVWLQGMTVQQS